MKSTTTLLRYKRVSGKFLSFFLILSTFFTFSLTNKGYCQGICGNWEVVGNPVSPAGAAFISLAVDGNGTPYVAYEDVANGLKASVKKFIGNAWVQVGSAGFTAGETQYISLAIDAGGTPYISYQDGANNRKASVMKFNGSAWVQVGTPGFTAGTACYTSLAIDGNGTPYIAYIDSAYYWKACVMKYNGSAWVQVGTPGFTAGEVNFTSLALNSSGTPYLAFSDYTTGGKASVMKYNGNTWVQVGTVGFSSGEVTKTSIVIDGNGMPFVVYQDIDNSGKASAMKYNGSTWVQVGSAGFTPSVATDPSIAIDASGTPYVAFVDHANYQHAQVYKYNGNSWVHIGINGLSAGLANITSCAVSGVSGTLYVSFQDNINSDKATVVKYALLNCNTIPTSVNGSLQTLNVCQNANAIDIKTLLHVSDTDAAQIETWSQSSAPSHGTLVFSSATASSGSTNITPGGNITYTPNIGYSGPDVFIVMVSDGANATYIMVNVTVNSTITPTVSINVSPNDTVCQGTTVTFTSTPTNGGTTPTYQWIKNGVNVGTNSNTYSYTPNNGDSVRCVMTSSIDCSIPVSSNTIHMTVGPPVTPTITVASYPVGTICAGATASYTANITNGGTNPSFQWIKNGSNVGANSSIYNYIPNNGDSVRCMLTSNVACASLTIVSSSTINMVVVPIVSPSIAIAASTTGAICAGTPVTYTATISNGGTTPNYQWIKNGANSGMNSATYAYTPNNNDSVRCVLTSNATCATPATVSSNTINMTVTPSVVSTLSIAVSPNDTLCADSVATYTATATNAGSSPTYQWKKNGINVGTNNTTYTCVPANGDSVRCVLTGSLVCSVPASSNTINMVVHPDIITTLSITGDTNVLTGVVVTYTAVTNVTGATFQWMVGGVNAGTNSNTFVYTPGTTDEVISCFITAPANSCASPGFGTAKVTAHIVSAGVTTTYRSTVQVYPNPANSLLHIDNITQATNYQLQNIVGQSVQQGIFSQQYNMLQIKDLPVGIYLLQLTNTQGQREVVRVVKE